MLGTVIADRREHITVWISQQMYMMTAQFVPAHCAGVYIQKRERLITLRAIDMSVKKLHYSNLLEKSLI
jgi:hypothetical protein